MIIPRKKFIPVRWVQSIRWITPENMPADGLLLVVDSPITFIVACSTDEIAQKLASLSSPHNLVVNTFTSFIYAIGGNANATLKTILAGIYFIPTFQE